MKEQNIQNLIRKALSKSGVINWRNNVGKAWIGKSSVIRKHTTLTLSPGDVVIKQARRFIAGLCEGSSDVIGMTPTVITQEMVGKTVGIFTAIEIKTPRGKPSEAQTQFIEVVKSKGGLAGIARSVDEAIKLVDTVSQ